MKRILCLLTLLVCCLSPLTLPAMAEDAVEGVFVPSYTAFVNRFCEDVATWNPEYAELLKEKMAIDALTSDDTSIYLDKYYGNFYITVSENFGHLQRFYISVTSDVYDEYSDDFYSLMDSSIKAIRLESDESRKVKTKEDLLVQQILDSPMTSASNSLTDGMYRYSFDRSSDRYYFHLFQTLYD